MEEPLPRIDIGYPADVLETYSGWEPYRSPFECVITTWMFICMRHKDLDYFVPGCRDCTEQEIMLLK